MGFFSIPIKGFGISSILSKKFNKTKIDTFEIKIYILCTIIKQMYSILQNFQEYKTENKMFHFPFQVWKGKQKTKNPITHHSLFFLFIYKLFQNLNNFNRPFK
jgi:ABC-type anion transport system duplicated permease subunit